MRNEFDKVKMYFFIAILFPVIFFFVMKITLLNIVITVIIEITWYSIYKDRLKHFKFVLEKNKKEKSKPSYIISTKVIKKLPSNVITYTYKFNDYTIHDIFDKSSTDKKTLYRTDKKYCYVYYYEKEELLEVKRKVEYEKVLKQNFIRHENRGSYEDF